MKRALGILTIALTLFLLHGASAMAEGEERTLIGEYVWNQGPTGDLKAVFKPTGDSSWEVAFYFDFRDKPHTYEGTATGNLKDGKLTGTVKNESRQRTFTFEGAFAEDGSFTGTHAETTPGRARDTGTLTLGAPSASAAE